MERIPCGSVRASKNVIITSPRFVVDEKTGVVKSVIDVYDRKGDLVVAHLDQCGEGWKACTIYPANQNFQELTQEAIKMANEHYPNSPKNGAWVKVRDIINGLLRRR